MLKVINNTNYLNDECVEAYALRYEERLFDSKTGMIQIPVPAGYLTLEIDKALAFEQSEMDVGIETYTTYVIATLEHKNTGRLD